MTTPDLMPILARGGHSGPQQGACIMEYASFLAGEPWTDAPACTDRVLAGAARSINDRMSDEGRQLLLPLLPRLMGTGDTSGDRRVITLLAVWSAERVLHLVRPELRGDAESAIASARTWLDAPTPINKEAAAEAYRKARAAAAYADAYADAAYAYADAAYAAAYAAAAAAYAAAADAYAYAAYAYAAAAYAADAAAAYAADAADAYAAYAAAAAGRRRQSARDTAYATFLTELIDEYDRITGRTEAAHGH